MSVIRKNGKTQPPRTALKSVKVRRNRKKGAASARSGRRSRLLKPLAAVFAIGLISVGLVAGYIGITTSEWLAVNDITVKGACLLSEEMILEQAGVKPGDNILALNLKAVGGNLKNHPWIAAARVDRRLPAAITVVIKEYEPLAVVDLGKRYFMDENRQIFKVLDDAAPDKTDKTDKPDKLPLITGLDYRDLDETGRPGSELFEAALTALETGNRLRRLLPGMTIRRVEADRDMGITLHAFNDIDVVRLGFDHDKDQYFKKFNRLKDLLSRLNHGSGSFSLAAVDLTCPERIVVKPETVMAVSRKFQKGG